jgi:two-component system, chemotaxis family, protein-glutamate methylesterase/glutaminase
VEKLLRILIVDDSAFVRKVIKQMLSRSPFLDVVGVARDGAEALEMVEELRPDVVTLDLNMPGTDGLSFLRQQMARRPVAVLIVSIASRNGEQVLLALEAGAVDVVQKPTGLATEKVLEMADELVAKVKAAASARLDMLKSPPRAKQSPAKPLAPGPTAVDVVVLGISTGGPQALKYLVPQLPADFPVPLLIVLHMPIGFTELYARSLAELSHLHVAEAKEGDLLRPGVVLLAPAGYHLSLTRRADNTVVTHLDLNPMELAHRPAADVLFQSAAEVYGARVLGVVMTGMGSDGTKGSAWIKAQGGRILTEAEESCVVYGMPRAVIEAGLSDRAEPLTRMGEALGEMI